MLQVAALLADVSKARGVFHCQMSFSAADNAESDTALIRGVEFAPSADELEAAMLRNADAIVAVRTVPRICANSLPALR